MNNEVQEKIKQIDTENFIWLIYIGIIILSWYSNSLEKKYYLYNDTISKEKYRKILIFIFTILVVVYYYFLSDSYKGIQDLKYYDSSKKKDLVNLSFVASLLIFISGLIFLYIAVEDTDLNVELAFN